MRLSHAMGYSASLHLPCALRKARTLSDEEEFRPCRSWAVLPLQACSHQPFISIVVVLLMPNYHHRSTTPLFYFVLLPLFILLLEAEILQFSLDDRLIFFG